MGCISDLGAYDFGTLSLQPLDYVEGSVRYFSNGTLQPSPTVVGSSPLTVSGITVPANGVATLAYTATVNSFAPPGADGSIVNTAVINGSESDITVTETVSAQDGSVLDISKSLSPTTVTQNGQLTYTFVIRNSGNTPADAGDNIVVTDTFTPALSDITVTYNGELWSSPASYSYDETTGVFATVPGAITVPAATFTQDVTTGSWVVTPGSAVITVTGTI